MAQNLQLNPQTRDYITVNGSPVPSDRIEEAAYFALRVRQGQAMYCDDTQGSLLYTLENSLHAPDFEQRVAAYSQDAILRRLINTGKATASATGNLQTTRTGSSNQVQLVPNQTQLAPQLNFNSV